MISVSQRRLSRGAEALTSRHHTSEVAQRLTLSPAAAELGSPIHDDSARISLFDAIYKDTGAPKQNIFKKGDVQTISAVLWRDGFYTEINDTVKAGGFALVVTGKYKGKLRMIPFR